jgi:hypothetical protein
MLTPGPITPVGAGRPERAPVNVGPGRELQGMSCVEIWRAEVRLLMSFGRGAGCWPTLTLSYDVQIFLYLSGRPCRRRILARNVGSVFRRSQIAQRRPQGDLDAAAGSGTMRRTGRRHRAAPGCEAGRAWLIGGGLRRRPGLPSLVPARGAVQRCRLDVNAV